ncbi:aminotransferase class V-fold PLP-dependent enzyme [endosymbiont of Pachyrhynchus infernalis]|uniref:aminotransferase class V-fold PLP-dependent enzyme n=1 Tax=endosymbiont of Pachyrhynchus infernalis TaxID=1971488 RepID=UPI000DC73B88|nr:aminotransferase class V-fold PLP-dependent enzyme [endosymbiont of Pachyrhynchus infernalis]BBA84862.1 cysteine desulfurase [endosymbiont of Pachyrhynchus infernalis]
MYDINKIRSKFPMLNNNNIYLDNASSTYKPISVINEIINFYKNKYSSYNRNIDLISINNKKNVEYTREYISKFINSNYDEIVFTTGSTESINLIANSLLEFLDYNDNILISIIEHHSNILPWYKISEIKKIKINIIQIYNNGILNLNSIKKFINKKTKIVSISHVSNVLGIQNPITKIIKLIKSINENTIILIDGSQSISHINIDVKKLNCDFYIFSGHKIYSSYGIGILYGKSKLLKKISPYKLGGSIIKYFKKNKPIYLNSPWKFESGSIDISGIFSIRKSIEFIKKINLDKIILWERNITNYAINLLNKIPNIIIYGNINKTPIISFNIKNINCYDINFLLNKNNIIIRSGNQCSIPLMNRYNISGVCRISFALYTNYEDINTFIKKLKLIISTYKK